MPDPLQAVGVGRSMDKEFERPDWTPLEWLIGNGCSQFMWMWRQGGIESISTSTHGGTCCWTLRAAVTGKQRAALSQSTWAPN
jgi:hypothetical protein